MHFIDDKFENAQNVALTDWYRPDGAHKTDIDWVYHEHHSFAMHLKANAALHNEEWVFCFNSAARKTQFQLDVFETQSRWTCVLDTSCAEIDEYREVKAQTVFNMPPRSFRIYYKSGIA